VRDQRVIEVAIYPFQYNPATGALRWHKNMQVEIRFLPGREAGSPVQTCGAACPPSPFDAVLRAQLLNGDQAAAWRSLPQISAQGRAPYTPPFLGDRYAITIDRDGLYRLSYAGLQAAGMDVDAVDPANLQLFNFGAKVAVYVSGEADGSFNPGDYLTFYGEKFRGKVLAERYWSDMYHPGSPGNNWLWQCGALCELKDVFEKYTDDNVYYLVVADTPGERMLTTDGTPTDAFGTPDYFLHTEHAEDASIYWSFERAAVDSFFWDAVTSNNITSTYPITLTEVSSLPISATVHAEIVSFASSGSSPDHHTVFTLNGGPGPVDDAYWDGQSRYSFETTIPQADLLEGRNELHYTLVSDTAVFAPFMMFDFYAITYARNFTAVDDQILFAQGTTGGWQYQIDGFTTNTLDVFDVLDPFNFIKNYFVRNELIEKGEKAIIFSKFKSDLKAAGFHIEANDKDINYLGYCSIYWMGTDSPLARVLSAFDRYEIVGQAKRFAAGLTREIEMSSVTIRKWPRITNR